MNYSITVHPANVHPECIGVISGGVMEKAYKNKAGQGQERVVLVTKRSLPRETFSQSSVVKFRSLNLHITFHLHRALNEIAQVQR